LNSEKTNGGNVKMRSFKEFMAERREVNRWLFVSTFMLGAFCGALLATAFIWVAFV